MLITGNSRMDQAGGVHVIDGNLSVHGWLYYPGHPVVNEWRRGDYRLCDGTLSMHNLNVGLAGNVIQSGGTNQVAGNLTLARASYAFAYYLNGYYGLDGGLLMASNIFVSPGPARFFQNGGRVVASNISLPGAAFHQANGSNQVTGGITISSFRIPDYYYHGAYQSGDFTGSYQMDDGLLMVSNLVILERAQFSQNDGQVLASNMQLIDARFKQTGGNLTQSGLLTLDGHATLMIAAGKQHFGQLQLGAPSTNGPPYLQLPAGPCVLRFADSSSLTWSTQAVLHIGYWSGSPYGGGNQRIIFGTNSAALTAQQLSQILFLGAAGLPLGPYYARILPTGEIVPDTGAPLPLVMGLPNQTNGAMQFAIRGEIGCRYAIEVSTNLLHWAWWTNQLNTDGMLFISDCSMTNNPVRFYRAVLLP